MSRTRTGHAARSTPAAYRAFSDEPLVDLAAGSAWVARREGLAEASRRWHVEQVSTRRAAVDRARALARPRPHPRTVVAMARIGSRFGFFLVVGVLASLVARVRGRRASSGAVRTAQSLVRAGGPAYVKAGQLVATASGVLPDAWTSAFAWCRDEVSPLAPGVAEARVEAALGCPLDKVFASFDPVPLAAASIAQVHEATLLDGTEVIVKVQRPGLRARFEDDIRVMAVLGFVADRVSKHARVANVPGFVELFAEIAFEEIDFRFEALNMVEVGLANEAAGIDDRCHVPLPYPDLVGETVLVMERMDGIRYTDAAERYPDLDGHELTRLGMGMVLEQALMFGVFHGDLHAGNVLVCPDLSFSLVDFGIIGRVTAAEREALIQMLLGFTRQDVPAQVAAIARFDVLPEGVDLLEIAAEFERTSSVLLKMADAPLADVDFEAMTAQVVGIIRLLSSHGFRAPKELVLFSKNLLYLNGLAQVVARDINILQEIEPMMVQFVTKYPEALAALLRVVVEPGAGDGLMYEFLSPEWIEAVRGIRDEYAPAVEAQAREAVGNVSVNLLVTGVPGGEDVRAHAALRPAGTELDLGHAADATILVTLDYDTARSAVVEQDLQAVVRGFLFGKIAIKGDLGALLGTEGADATALLSAFDISGITSIGELDPTAGAIADRIRAVTA